MSQFHLFPPTTAVPFSPFTSTPFQSPPSSIQQIPIQLQFQLAAWQTFRFRQHEQMLNALNMAKSQMANKDNRIEEADVVSIDAESASNDDQKASPGSNAENTSSPPNGIHKPQPVMLPFISTNKTEQKNVENDFRFVESLIVREPLSAWSNNNQMNLSQISKHKKKRSDKASTSSSSTNSPPLIVRSCPICQKKFTRHWLLQGHIRTHTGERPFKCSTCGKAFADKSNLRAHTQTHSGVKNHVCQRCGKRFALKSYLSKHEESSCNIRNPHNSFFFRSNN